VAALRESRRRIDGRMRFTEYAVLSTTVAAAVVFYAFASRVQFYPAVIFLVTSKPAIMVLGNMAFVFTILLGRITNKIFLGRLREAEREIIWENLRYAFTETCLALSTFREEMSLNVVMMFTALLFCKVFHWLCEARVEHMEQAQETSTLSHFRTVSLMALLFATDAFCAAISLEVVQAQGASVQVFFGFEYVLLGIKVLEIFVKHVLAGIDTYFIQGQWYNKSLYEMYLKLIIEVLQLFVNVVFFAIIFTYYGVPLHLMRQLYIAVKNVHDRLTHFWRFRRITANLHDRFPNATEEDLINTDRVCIICREEMIAGDGVGAPKKLHPCGHIFHFYCLRNWLERQLKCPTCRTDISPRPTENVRAVNALNEAAQQQHPQAQPQAQPNAPVEGQQQNQDRQDELHGNDQHEESDPAQGDDQTRAQQWQAHIPLRRDSEFSSAAGLRSRVRQRNFESQYAQGEPTSSNQQTDGATHSEASSNRTAQTPFQARQIPSGMASVWTQPPLGFPMRPRPTNQVTENSVPMADFPSVAQYLQSQIEVLQLQLQVYQAQVNAATATRRAAMAAMRAREFQERQMAQDDSRPKPPSQPTSEADDKTTSESSPPPVPPPAPVSMLTETDHSLPQRESETQENEPDVSSEPNDPKQILRMRASVAAQRRMQEQQQHQHED